MLYKNPSQTNLTHVIPIYSQQGLFVYLFIFFTVRHAWLNGNDDQIINVLLLLYVIFPQKNNTFCDYMFLFISLNNTLADAPSSFSHAEVTSVLQFKSKCYCS